jgi:uncharacterized SAM-binding protein YcdF (DUF218 family)
MLILTKLISRIFFPVALVIELLITGLILIHVRRRRLGYFFCIAALLLLMSASLEPVADLFLWTLEGRYQPIERVTPDLKKKIDYIVVLGSGHSERSELSATARLSPSATGRVTEAIRLSSKFPGVLIIFTGGTIEGGKVAIGEAASRAAKVYGLSSSRIIVERYGLNTAGEALAVSSLVGNKTVLLVTSASHMRRALGLFKAAGIHAVPAPADYQALGGSFTLWSFIIPSAQALQKTERAWYEYLGLAWNAVRGVGW